MSESEYPENFIDALKFKAAMGWAEEHGALLKHIDMITDMLRRICQNESYGVIEMRLPDDILEWWEKHQ